MSEDLLLVVIVNLINDLINHVDRGSLVICASGLLDKCCDLCLIQTFTHTLKLCQNSL